VRPLLADTTGDGGLAGGDIGHLLERPRRPALLLDAFTGHGAGVAAFLGDR
jgi:hypothetical protein